MELKSLFITSSLHHLCDEFLNKIEKSLNTLSENDLWWRPHEHTTSIGNLLCHLEGNVRQWIISGLGKTESNRNRALEFSKSSGGNKTELFSQLKATVQEASTIISQMNESTLLQVYLIQGTSTTGLEAIYHVVEHFGWHTGQIVWITKMRLGENHELKFYNDSQLNAHP